MATAEEVMVGQPIFEGVQADDISGRIEDTILGAMHTLFPYGAPPPERHCAAADLPLEIHSALAGTQALRIQKAPSGEALKRNLTRIEAMVEAGQPISMFVLIGSAKFPDGTVEQNEADLADFAGIQTIMTLDQRVRSVYAPGTSVRAYYEDVVGDWLFGEHCWPAQERYWDTLKQLHTDTEAQFGHNPIHLVREESIMASLGVSLDDFRNRAEAHRLRFHEYLFESDEIMTEFIQATPYQTWDEARRQLGEAYPGFVQGFADKALLSLSSFKALQEQGWQGVIPPEMREFYLGRIANNAHNIGEGREAWMTYMARYYGSTLLKAQLRSAVTPREEDASLGFNPQFALKLSLLGLAPGIPPAYRDAYQMRAVLNKPNRGGVDNSTAPWRAKGGVLVRECGEKARINITSTGRFDPTRHVPARLALVAGGVVNAPIEFRQPQAAA